MQRGKPTSIYLPDDIKDKIKSIRYDLVGIKGKPTLSKHIAAALQMYYLAAITGRLESIRKELGIEK